MRVLRERVGEERAGQAVEQPERAEGHERAGRGGEELAPLTGRERDALGAVGRRWDGGRARLGREGDDKERRAEQPEEDQERESQRVRRPLGERAGDERPEAEAAEVHGGGDELRAARVAPGRPAA